MACSHDSAYHVRVLNATLLGCPITLVCDRCKVNLPLGQATAATREEVEAATIIADVMANVEHITDWQIAIGMAAYDADNDPPTGGLAWMWHAGWLARHIWKESNP